MLREIIETIEEGNNIPLGKVKVWTESDDIQIMAGGFYILTNYYDRVKPEPKLDDYYCFFLKYLVRCIKDNYDINAYRFILSRYIAAHYLYSWFKDLWKDKTISSKNLLEIKKVIEDIYKEHDEDIKICVITGILEHLFTDKGIRKYFQDWLEDPILKPAYEEAIEYSKYLNKPKKT